MKTLNNTKWKSGNLAEIADVVMGQSPPGDSYNSESVGMGLINGPTEFTKKYPVVRQWTTKPTKMCRPNDILLCVRGSSTGRMNLSNGEYCIGRGIASVSGKAGKGETNFIFFLLEYKIGQLLKKTAGSTFPNLSSNEIKEMIIDIPSLKEQRKITEILLSWDRAIELKETLIEKKKEQKKGLMQILLTEKVRLPNFKQKWIDLKVKDLGTLKGGSGFPDKYQNEQSGKYPFFKVSDMNHWKNEKYMKVANNYINEEIQKEIKATIIPKNSIVFAKVGAALMLERKRILETDSCIDNNMMALLVKDTFDFNFVYYLFQNIKLSQKSNQGALPSLNAKDVYSIKCKIPKDYQEQRAIAQMLTLVDNEIDLLKKDLLQTKEQKKGLMQLLLTGKVQVRA